jgi:hypothetical protein
MIAIQVTALEKFLANNDFDYYDYDEEFGVVIYIAKVGDWIMEVAYGDECYYRSYNDVTEEANCEGFTNVSEIMTEYDKLYRLKQQLFEPSSA